MNMKIRFLCLSLCFAAAISMSIKDSMDEQWKDYKKKFHKTYKPEDEPIRKANFKKNVEKINLSEERFKNGEASYKMNINSIADMNPADYNKMQSKFGPEMFNYTEDVVLPPTFDWRINGTVSPVPDMGGCKQGDWAFAAVGMLEGYLFKKDGDLKQLSAQDLLECSNGCGNAGCKSGDVTNAFRYITENGISLEKPYPFKPDLGECKKTEKRILQNQVIQCTKFDGPKDEGEIKKCIVNSGPVAAKICAPNQFRKYKAGEIFTGGDGADADNDDDGYYVLIIGYGETESEKYWIVKNWMGKAWGEDGYAKITRDESKDKCKGNKGIFSKVIAIKDIKEKQLF